MGANLFDRKGRRLLLTPAGKDLAILLASFEKEFEELFSFQAGAGERLTLVAGSSIYETLIFPNLQEILSVTGVEKMAFKSFSTSGVLKVMTVGEADLGIVRSNAVTSQHIGIPCGGIDFSICVRRAYARDITDWNFKKVISTTPLACIGGQGDFITAFRSLCAELGSGPNVVLEAESFGSVKNLLLASATGAVLPKLLASEVSQEEFVCLEFEELKALRRELSVVVDRRAVKVRDRLENQAKAIAEVLMRG